MPRAKRTISQAFGEDIATEPSPAISGVPSEDNKPRPKRARKQTERFSSAPTATGPEKAKSRATKRPGVKRKGKGKALENDHEAPGHVTDSANPIANDTSTDNSDTKAPKEEKRLVELISNCPPKVMERAERIRTQRFFMIDRKREGTELKEIFKVLGSTANVYTVTVDRKPKCDCPDNRMGNHCKHIMFIFLKVLCVPIESHIWYQKALVTSELESVFAAAPEAPNSVSNPRVREAFLRATGQITESSTAASSSKKRIPGEEDDCPICYDTMFGVADKALVFCEECGNALHKECFVQYEKSARKSGRTLTCVWCRSERGVTGPTKPQITAKKLGAFINLTGAIPG